MRRLTPTTAPADPARPSRSVGRGARLLPLLLGLGALGSGPRLARAQAGAAAPRGPAVTFVGGAFGGGAAATGGRHPLVGARAARALRPWLVGEAGAALTSAVRPVGRRPSGQAVRLVDGRTVELRVASADRLKIPILTPELGVQAQLPLGRLRPYAGAGAGLLVALGGGDTGEYFVRPAVFGAAGLRVDLGRRLGARGEVRLRADSYPGASAVRTTEQTAGLSWQF
jgi:hypothetical protein